MTQYFLDIPRDGKPVILGGFSAGSILAARIAEHHLESVDGMFVISGVLGAKEFFKNLNPGYGGLPVWESVKLFFHDCVARRSQDGYVKIQGDPEVLYQSFRSLVEGGLNIEEVFDLLTGPKAIIHSEKDIIVPFEYVRRFFPETVPVLLFEMDHEMNRLDSPGNCQGDIADKLSDVFS